MDKFRNCVTHHHACDCREAYFTSLTKQIEIATKILIDAKKSIKLLHEYRGFIEENEGPSIDYVFKNLDVDDIDEALEQINKLKSP